MSLIALSVTVLLAACFSQLTAADSAPTRSPILIVPGLTSSPLNARDDSNTSCNTNGENIRIYVNLTHSVNETDCFVRQLTLNYSQLTSDYSDAMDVTVTAANFGSTSSVEFLDVERLAPVFYPFVQYFAQRGYTRDVNIRAAPYDYRLSTEQLEARGFYTDLKVLIQMMYEENNNTRVTIVVHSMGGPVSLYFLTRFVTQEWKDMYIHSYVTLAGAWSGGNEALSGLLSGPDPLNLLEQPIGREGSRDLYRTFASFYLLSPRASVWNDTVLVVTPTQNYTANDYEQLYTDAGYPQGYAQFSAIPLDWPAPNVDTYCFYGLDVETPMTFVYDNTLSLAMGALPTNTINGDGDGTVNRPSSEVCLRWSSMPSDYTFNRTTFSGVNHSAIIFDDAVLQAIESVAQIPENPTINGALPISKHLLGYHNAIIASLVYLLVLLY